MDEPNRNSDTAQHSTDGLSRTIDAGVNAIVATVKAAIDGEPTWCKAIVGLSAVAGILCLVCSVAFLLRGYPQHACGVMAGALVLFVFSLVAVVWITGKSSARALNCTRGTIPWARAVPKQPISADEMPRLRRELDEIRSVARQKLIEEYPDLQDSEVRANVFLPDITKATNGEVCELAMPEQLKIGMAGHPDNSIRFRPRQGLTGVVFIEQKPMCAYSTMEATKGKADGVARYELSAEQTRQINRSLSWIVSFPLVFLDEGRQRAGGVLSIDGLNHEISDDHLTGLLALLTPRVARFQDMLAALPKTRVTISLEDI